MSQTCKKSDIVEDLIYFFGIRAFNDLIFDFSNVFFKEYYQINYSFEICDNDALVRRYECRRNCLDYIEKIKNFYIFVHIISKGKHKIGYKKCSDVFSIADRLNFLKLNYEYNINLYGIGERCFLDSIRRFNLIGKMKDEIIDNVNRLTNLHFKNVDFKELLILIIYNLNCDDYYEPFHLCLDDRKKFVFHMFLGCKNLSSENTINFIYDPKFIKENILTFVFGNNLIHYAARCSDPYFIKKILEYDAGKLNINIKNHKGLTPLQIAAYYNNFNVMNVLIRYENLNVLSTSNLCKYDTVVYLLTSDIDCKIRYKYQYEKYLDFLRKKEKKYYKKICKLYKNILFMLEELENNLYLEIKKYLENDQINIDHIISSLKPKWDCLNEMKLNALQLKNKIKAKIKNSNNNYEILNIRKNVKLENPFVFHDRIDTFTFKNYELKLDDLMDNRQINESDYDTDFFEYYTSDDDYVDI